MANTQGPSKRERFVGAGFFALLAFLWLGLGLLKWSMAVSSAAVAASKDVEAAVSSVHLVTQAILSFASAFMGALAGVFLFLRRTN